MIDPVVTAMLVAVLALILLASALEKAKNLRWFAQAVGGYGLLPEIAVRPTASAVPLAEFCCALALVYAPTRVAGAAGTIVLFAMFAAALAINLLRGRRDIDCGCWGPAGHAGGGLSGWLLARNGVLIALAAPLLLPTAERTIAWADAFITVSGTVALLFLFAAAERLIAMAPRLARLKELP